MQLYALDSKEKLINARQAIRKTNYTCFECKQVVRLRGGPQRQPHFYHLDPTPECRQHQKGPIHLHLQSWFLEHLPTDDCLLEHPFPSIQRIGDVAWISEKIVFEIQCSPISAQEVLARNRDYNRAGWGVVWILHDGRYNQQRLSAAESALRLSSHFYSNMDKSGKGMIYDQFDLINKGFRIGRLSPLPVDLTRLSLQTKGEKHSFSLEILKERNIHWHHSFSGDLMSLFLESPDRDYFAEARVLEEHFLHTSSSVFYWYQWPIWFWRTFIATPYRIFFHFLLERICR